MSLSSIQGPGSASYSALNGLNQAVNQVEDVARHVADGINLQVESSISDRFGQIARLPVLRQQALANAKAFGTVEDIFLDLVSLPRS